MQRRSKLRAVLLVSPLCALALFAPSTGAAPATRAETPQKWVGETSEATIEHAKARGVAANAKESDVLAAIAVIANEASVAGHGVAAAALEEIAKSSSPWDEARAEARVVARAIADDEGTKAGTVADAALGIVTDASIVGPFRDTGGGLARREGPEEKGAKLSDPNANWSWGSVDVRWRTASSDASGVDLDLLIEPRKESCSIVTTTVTLEKETSFVVRLAATGQARLAIDGVDAGSNEDANDSALFDRIAARADKAPAGTHTVLAKICTGAMSDDGRVRLRITDDKGARLEAKATADRTEPPTKAPHVTKLGTPLSRALAAKGDADTQLAIAALRTFGGADDARSPRAAGILDAVVHRLAPDDADRLAMAGWIATSGANRSGWLNEARARAEKAGDNEIGAFCTRRLAAERFNARLADWAQATMASVTGNDPEAVALRAEIKSGLGSEALRLEAFHELVRAVDAAPDRASDAMLEQLAKVASGLAPARETATRIALAKRGERDSAYVASIRERGKAVLAAIETFDAGPSDAGDAVDIVNVVLANGDPKSGAALAERLAMMAPNRADVWTTLADALAALQRTPKVAAEMTAALERARMLAPGDARTKGLLALGEKTTAAGDEHYLVEPQVFLAKRQGVPKPGVAPEVADRELYWLRAVVMHPDKRVSQLIQYAREIVIPPRTQEELVEELPAEGDLTEILKARVYRKGGGTAFPVEEHDEGSRPHVRWPDLEPGDVVEVALRTWTATAVGGRGDAPFYFVDYAGAPSTHPLLYNEVNVESPKDHPLYVDVVHGNADKREERDVGNVHVTRLVWNKPVMVAEEPLSPAMSEIVPVIVGSTFKSWGDFRAWYAQAVQGFTEPDDQVRRLAAELTKGKSSREDKVRAIFDFVSDDIRYVNYVSGEWWLPNRPQQLLARREGDCDDKAMLLITLLKSIGITAQEVMVQTRETAQPSILKAKNVAAPLFDHGIAFLPGVSLPGTSSTSAGTYLDATSPQSRLGPLPSMDARAVALKMDQGPAEIVDMPASSPADHGSKIKWLIALKADGSGDLSGEEEDVGDGAFWLRTNLTEEGARQEYVRDNLVGGYFSAVDVDKQIDFKGDLPGGRAWVKYKAHSGVMARREDQDLVLPLSPSATMTSNLAPLVRRTLPVSLPPQLAPSHQARTMTIEAPAGYAWATLPTKGDVNGGEFGSAHLDVARDPKNARAIIVTRNVTLDMSLIPVEKYTAWRGFLQQIDALMHKSVRLVKTNELVKITQLVKTQGKAVTK